MATGKGSEPDFDKTDVYNRNEMDASRRFQTHVEAHKTKRVTLTLKSGYEVGWIDVVGHIIQFDGQMMFETSAGALIAVDVESIAVFEVEERQDATKPCT